MFFLIAICNVWADTVKVGTTSFSTTATVANKPLVLNGAGMRVKLFHKVYTLGLYVPTKSNSPADLIQMAGPKLLLIQMVRDVDAKTFVKALQEGLEDNNSRDTLDTLKPQIDQLEKLMVQTGTAKIGDVIKFEFNPSVGTQIIMNGKKLGLIGGGSDFYNAMLKIWLGKESVDGDLKISLLGG